MSESALVKRLKDELKSMGYWVIKLHGSNFQQAGLPDLLALKGGRAVWIEVKCPGEQPTKLQDHTLGRLNSMNFTAGCVHSVEELRELLNRESS